MKTRTKLILQKTELLWHVYTIPCLYSPEGSIKLMVWLQFALYVLAKGSTLQISPSPQVRPHLTQRACHWNAQV